MERRQPTFGGPSRHAGVFLVTCVLHAGAVYWMLTQGGVHQASLWTTQVSFIPAPKKTEPPPPPIPVPMQDVLSEPPPLIVPRPEIEIALPVETRQTIRAQTPDQLPPVPPPRIAPRGEEGNGPFARPRVLSGPDSKDRYPGESVRSGESGRVVITICISADGVVDHVEVAESSGYPRLDQAAVGIGRDYVFAPATRDGKPIRVCLPYGITFRIGVGGISRDRDRR